MKFKSFLVTLLICMLMCSITLNVYADTSDISNQKVLTDNQLDRIDDIINKYIKKGRIPGASVVIVNGEETIYNKSFGYADKKNNVKVTPETLFEVGSNSKAYTGLAIMKLVNENKISLDDEISKYIPWFSVKFDGKDVPITIQQVLYQTSGIPFKTIDSIPETNEENALEETVKAINGIELDRRPGVAHEYATINYDILALVIQNATNMSYEDYMINEIFKPLKMDNTCFDLTDENKDLMSKGYMFNFFTTKQYDAPIYRGNRAAGYILSNAEDIAKWLKVQIGCASDIDMDKSIIEASHIPNRRVQPAGDGSSYAAGWFVYQIDGGQIEHGGNNPSFSSQIIFEPEDKVGVAVLCNINSQYTAAMCQEINAIVLDTDITLDVKDMNKTANTISVVLLVAMVLLGLVTLFFVVKNIVKMIAGKLKFKHVSPRNLLTLLFAVLFVGIVTYGIYLLPYTLYNGVSWPFVFVWLPITLKYAVISIVACIWLLLIFYIFNSFFETKNDKPILLLTILSLLSGFGNALIIFTINTAINVNNQMRLNYFIYFCLGLILYVVGQKETRKKLIEYTNEIVYTQRIKIIAGLLKSHFERFEKIDRGRINATLNNDTEMVSIFANTLITGLTSAVTLIFCFLYLGFLDVTAILLAAGVIVVIASAYFLIGRRANRYAEESRDVQNTFFQFINHLVDGFKELTLNNKRKQDFNNDMNDVCGEIRVKRGKAQMAFADMFVVGELLFTTAIGVLVFLFPLVIDTLTPAKLQTYVFILLYITGPVHGILNVIPDTIQVKVSLRRINGLLEELDKLNSDNNEPSEVSVGKGFDLKLQDVEYAYINEGDNKDDYNFKVGPFDIDFKSSEVTFITGGNGSGKSTLAKIITGLYNPTKGSITMNNKVIDGVTLSQQYSAVFGDFYLFEKLYGINQSEKQDIIDKYMDILQLGKKTTLENGVFSTIRLSTGQRKRLALLISYLEDRPIFLFDEWAADQDPEFRQFFYENLLPELKSRGKCVIAITHDDRYFHLADKVIKLEMGKVVQDEFAK